MPLSTAPTVAVVDNTVTGTDRQPDKAENDVSEITVEVNAASKTDRAIYGSVCNTEPISLSPMLKKNGGMTSSARYDPRAAAAPTSSGGS